MGRVGSWLRERVAGEWQAGSWLRRLRHVVRVLEAEAPVAEVGADDEGVRRFGEIGGQEGSKSVLGRGRGGSNHDRDERGVLRGWGVGVLEL